MCRGAPKLCSRAIPEDASRANLEEIVDQALSYRFRPVAGELLFRR